MSAMPLDPLRLPLHGVRLIEASAGTGKTWTIAALYLRLVLGHGGAAPLLPAQILVLTFTKAATAELRDRIRARLTEAAAVFRAQQAPDAFLAALLADYPEADARAAAARQLELAAQWMDEAAVHTIHGWAQRMLAQHAFDSGHPFVQDIQTDDGELLAEAVRDYWRLQCLPLGRDAAALLERWWRDPRALQQSLRPLLRQPATQLRLHGQPLPQSADVRAILEAPLARAQAAMQRARALWLADLGAIERQLEEALRDKALHGRSYPLERLPQELAALRGWAEGGPLRGWAEGGQADDKLLARYAQSRLDGAANKNRSAPAHAAFAAIEQALASASELELARPLILAHALPWVAERIDLAKRRRALLGFDDMLRRLDEALHGPAGARLADTIAAQYPLALIDEFQDTDPLQWRIFHRLYAARPELGLLLIGDPKQAIYAFRGADIHTYLQARQAAVPPVWTLGTNHRSTAALVSAVNRLFEHADRHADGAFAFGRGEHGLPFHPAQARGRAATLVLDGEPLPALQLAVLDEGQNVGSTAYRQRMAAHAANWLSGLFEAARAGRCGFASPDGLLVPLAPGDVAILVRSGREAALVRAALREAGLRSVYLSDRDSVFSSPEAADLLLWLKACAEPGSDRAMRAALATRSLDRDDAELDRLNTDERWWEACGERLRELQQTWRRHGVLAMLHDLLHAFDLPARLLAHDGGERALTNLLHLAELLQQAAGALDGEHALIRHLAEQISDAREGQAEAAEEQIVRLESEAELVKVVTVHKSKGLEYPLVLLPFACAARELKRDELFVWHDGDGRPQMDLEPDDQAWAQAERERLQEDLRLLYVALTRARYACWVGVASVSMGNAKASSLHKSAFGYLLAGGAPIEAPALLPALLALRGGATAIAVDALPEALEPQVFHPAPADGEGTRPARSYAGHPGERWWIASYSALKYDEEAQLAGDAPAAPETPAQDVLAEAGAEKPTPVLAAAEGQGIHAFPRGAVAGTFLHDLLEWAAEQGFAAVAADPQPLAELIARRVQRHGWQAQAALLAQWVPALLRTPLTLGEGRSLALAELSDTARYRAELEFWFAVHEVDTRALDRLVTAQTLDARPRMPLLQDQLNGMLKGFIDLLFEHDGRYYVVDYKSNWLGVDAAAYTAEAVRDSVLRERYDLQYAIYTLALHRQLRARLPDYDYQRHVGGVLYLYLRGMDGAGHGIHHERLPLNLVEAMDRLFAEGGRADAA